MVKGISNGVPSGVIKRVNGKSPTKWRCAGKIIELNGGIFQEPTLNKYIYIYISILYIILNYIILNYIILYYIIYYIILYYTILYYILLILNYISPTEYWVIAILVNPKILA